MFSLILLYIPCASEDEARSIGRTLIEEKLAACVNIFPRMQSISRWKGKTEESEEAVLIVKTLEEHAEEAASRIKQLHSYDCPCIIRFPAQVNTEYGTWMRSA